ncbi:MAG TPA: MBL fold metallo-hydrolase [Stellaceae bacterium]|jgi:glyoxylase-like metal-dependent hydrolase (beta-lactamase superfamily II)|nr:MBL fold metallo-hydrolase [Stellaceae bacterium]
MSPDAGGALALDYLYERNPEAGAVVDIAPGVRWLTMPLPGSLNHINLWLLDDGDGVALVDTGIASIISREVWQKAFAGPLKGRKITRLIVTHAHPDHIGLAGWLTELLGIELWISEMEWSNGRRFSTDGGKIVLESSLALFRRGGLGKQAEAMAQSRPNTRLPTTPVPEKYHRLEDGMVLRIGAHDWHVIVGRGHAPEHCCLWAPALDIFIAGDQVLPKITPNVSLWPGREDDDPLGSFLATTDKLERIVPDSVLVLPSHNLPFHRLHNRLRQLRDHHADRMAEVMAACDGPKCAAELVPVLFHRKLDQRQMAFAMGEALAHLQYGVTTGRLRRTERADGAWLFQRI